jgi:DNA primase
MAGRIPQSFIDDLLSRVDIVEVIDRYVPLKKTGANYKACCPFHGEKTPSFTVSQTKQFYHCFGCGVHGTAISFLMEFDHMHFVDAVEYLADRVGLEVPRDAVPEVSQTHKVLYQALQQSSAFFQQQLRGNQEAIDYLKRRGITGETAKTFQLGFAPSAWHALSEATDASEPLLVTAGMLVRNDHGKTHDRFRNRIMFPIRDRRGREIGFGGRVMDNSEPKYLNSPETPLFQKGRELYGLYELRRSHRKNPDRVIVVEGYMDVIALAEAGINNAVATLGTATSNEQVALLFRETDEIVFCFDGDSAGKKAARRALNSALPSLKSGRDARFMFLPDGEDPDSLVSAHGRDHFLNAIDTESLEASVFMFREMEAEAGMGDGNAGTGHRARLAELCRPMIEQIPAGVYRELVASQLEEKVGAKVFTDNTKSEATRVKRKPVSSADHSASNSTAAQSPVRRALAVLLNDPSIAVEVDPELYEFSDNIRGAALLMQVVGMIELNPEISTSRIIEHFRDRPEWQAMNKLAQEGLVETPDVELETPLAIFEHAIRQINQESKKLTLKNDFAMEKTPSQMSTSEKEELRKRLDALKKK